LGQFILGQLLNPRGEDERLCGAFSKAGARSSSLDVFWACSILETAVEPPEKE
jgi:hypothetical protein